MRLSAEWYKRIFIIGPRRFIYVTFNALSFSSKRYSGIECLKVISRLSQTIRSISRRFNARMQYFPSRTAFREHDNVLIFAKCNPCTASVLAWRRMRRVSCESTLSPGGSVSKEREKRKPENIRAANVWSAPPSSQPPQPCRIHNIARYIVNESWNEILVRFLETTIKTVESR